MIGRLLCLLGLHDLWTPPGMIKEYRECRRRRCRYQEVDDWL